MIKDLWKVLRGKLSSIDLANTQGKLSAYRSAANDYNQMVYNLLKAHSELALANARLIAKLEPMYGIPEDDPARRAESDALGERVLKQLLAEDSARRHTTG